MFRYLFSVISLLFVIISPCFGDIASSEYVNEMRDNVQAKIDKKADNSNYTQNMVLQTDDSGNVVATTVGTDLFADGAIETIHLADGAVTNADLAGMIDIKKLNLGTLPTRGKHMMIWNAETNEYVFERYATSILPDGYIYIKPDDELMYPMVVTGKNLFNKADYNGGGWYINNTTNSNIASTSANATVIMRAIPGKTYYYKHCSVTGGGRIAYTPVEDWTNNSEGYWLKGMDLVTVQANKIQSFTVPNDAKWIFILVGRNLPFQPQLDDYLLSDEVITADTKYEPYTGGMPGVAVQNIGPDGKQTGVFGYYNSSTGTFVRVEGMTGEVLDY